MSTPRGKDDYLVGILTALPIERAAIRAMLDREHPTPFDFERHPLDPNSYTWGSIASHNVVLASSPAGVYGTTSATTTILPMKYAFPQVKWGLMVGIAAGIPSEERDIRLGDVVVSQPKGNSSGVFQYDFGKVKENDDWESVGWLARPPEILLRALANLQSEHEFHGRLKARQHLNNAIERHRDWGKRYGFPQSAVDRLFLASYSHLKKSTGCSTCDISKVIKRSERDSSGFQVHYGVIASGNSLVKDAHFRDRIATRMDQCICLEMEAAGMMNDFPCLVIRGICDYGDSHKNDDWQRYASATAAAFAKELLGFISTVESRNQKYSIRTKSQPTVNHVNNPDFTNQPYHAGSATATNGAQCPLPDVIPMQNRSHHAGLTSATNGAQYSSSNAASPQNQQHKFSSTSRTTSRTDTNTEGKKAHDTSSRSTTSIPTEQRKAPLAKIKGKVDDLSNINKQSDSRGYTGHTLLHRAAADGDCDMAEILLELGANTQLRNKSDQTPLLLAAIHNHMGTARLLLDWKADLEAPDDLGFTPLIRAAQRGFIEVTRLLLDYHANIWAVTSRKWTALHYAARNGHVEVVEILLTSGACPPPGYGLQQQLSDLAEANGHSKVVELLKEHTKRSRPAFAGKFVLGA